MAQKKDYYEILGIKKDASKEDIKKAYKKLAKQYHPDVSKEANSTEKFKEINEAAGVLLDEEKRSQYDQFGHSFSGQDFNGNQNFYSHDFDFEDIVDQFFGDDFGFNFFSGSKGRKNRQRRGSDLKTRITITLEDTAKGVEKEILIHKDVTCNNCKGTGAENPSDIKTCGTCQGSGKVRISRQTVFGIFSQVSVCSECHGTGKVIKEPCNLCGGSGKVSTHKKIKIRIPKGIDEGVTLRLDNEGDAGLNGGPNGDLYVEINIKKNDIFERKGQDLYTQNNISLGSALFGDELEIKTIYGEKTTLKIPPATQSGTFFKLKGKGLPYFNSTSKGDMFIEVIVDIPKISNLSDDEEKILKKIFNKNIKEKKSFFNKIFK